MAHPSLKCPLLAFGLLLSTGVPPVLADGTDCVVYATDYANAHMGSGDAVGDAVSGGMAGAVVGGEWQGASGAYRGARAGAALGVLNNLGSMPGGWQALYDTAYQMCEQQASGVNAPYYTAPTLGTSDPDCRSSASVNAPLKRSPNGAIIAGSGLSGCQ
ncbi:hypothetical protein [Roseibium sediminicola]|uniref:Uncharacterized protein n=1 Tax=Roseibium sediminicola TaxID=2933272 RepID=A0ABT0GZN1_9HYPH|nr:hypothetical protein [Roseibium sp. CAU 1639]MCK7614786.1 hypothetical protein [Roseibium sp. CAU 1639]